jgi:hypothetical protein
MTKPLITYRGQEMSPDWPARIRAAQRKKTYTRAGVTAPRIPHGQEAYWSKPDMPCVPPTCGDCGVIPGELHVPNCDMEVCPFCLDGHWLCCTDKCPDHFDDIAEDIAALPETTEDVYAPRTVIPENQLPLR